MSYTSLDNKKYFDISQRTWCNWIRYDALFCCFYESGTTIQILLHFYWADRYPHIRIMDCEGKPIQKLCWLTNIFWHAIWWASDFVRKFLFANMILSGYFWGIWDSDQLSAEQLQRFTLLWINRPTQWSVIAKTYVLTVLCDESTVRSMVRAKSLDCS